VGLLEVNEGLSGTGLGGVEHMVIRNATIIKTRDRIRKRVVMYSSRIASFTDRFPLLAVAFI
jgi:hypothetical protein